MEKKKAQTNQSFSDFLKDPTVSLLILVFGLITLFFAIQEFTSAMAY